MRVHWCVRVRYACVQYPYGTRAWPCVFSAVLCGCVLPIRSGCKVRTYTGACALHVPRVYAWYGVRLGQPKQCILYVYVCMYGGRHVQLERCTTRREYVYVSVVQYMAWAAWAACVIYMGVCACTYVLCLYHLHSVSAWIAWAMYRFAYTRVLERVLGWTAWAMHRLRLGPHARARTLYLYTDSLWHI